MGLTDYQAKYFAHELTKRCASDSVEKLAAVLADAQVDLNPHQIEAELFAFRSPFSKGAILADKFFLPCVILESRSFNEALRAGNLNPYKKGLSSNSEERLFDLRGDTSKPHPTCARLLPGDRRRSTNPKRHASGSSLTARAPRLLP